MARVPVKTITVPAHETLIAALDELVEEERATGIYPPPTRTSVVRALIQEANAKMRRARAKRTEAA